MYLLGKSLVGFGHFGEDAGVLLGNDGADDQQRTDHQGHSDQQVDKYTKKVITDTIKEQIKKLKEDYENK